jgi:HNH endonuclease
MAFNIEFMQSYDRDSVAAELQRVATLTGKTTVNTREIQQLARVDLKTVLDKFGTLAKAHAAAGLDAPPIRKYRDAEVLQHLADLWTITLTESGRRPIVSDVRKYGLPFSECMVVRRFGTWRKALLAVRDATEGRIWRPVEKTPPKRRPISPNTRFEVFKRDLYTCRICGRKGVELVLDHVKPVCRGGTDEMENLQTLCVECNQGKGSNLQ